MAQLLPYQFSNYVEQVELLYVPTSCEIEYNSTAGACMKDIALDPRLRFYEIVVTAKDSAGREGTEKCQVIIVPECGTDTEAEKCELHAGRSFYNTEFLKNVADLSSIRYPITSASLSWDFSLSSDFDALNNSYNSRLRNSDRPSKMPSSEPSRQPSATPSNQPSDLPSKMPSSEPSDQPTSIPSSYPTFVPVIECGFDDIDHIHVVENKTLFFYSEFEYENQLQNSHFYYEVLVSSDV